VVVIVGTGTTVADFHGAWVFFTLAAVSAGVVLSAVGTGARAPATAPAAEPVPAS
jgi:hypothetical protein